MRSPYDVIMTLCSNLGNAQCRNSVCLKTICTRGRPSSLPSWWFGNQSSLNVDRKNEHTKSFNIKSRQRKEPIRAGM